MNQVPSAAVQMPHANFVSRLLYLPRGISRLEKLGQKKSFPKNHMLVQAGTRTNYCYIVKKGRVAAFETTVTGEERIYNFNESNSLVLEGNLLFDQESPVNFKTVQPSELVCITKEMLLEGIAGSAAGHGYHGIPFHQVPVRNGAGTAYEFSQCRVENLRSPSYFCGALRRAL